MTTLRASSLDVAGFRGIRRSLSLQFGRKLTIIYGGNASGKSSLSQAIEFALTGQVLDYEDKPIPARYLTHTNSSDEGSVTLRLTDGSTNTPLTASTTEARTEIEQRFRTIGSVDWPDRQRVPITTTHIMAQGALAKVLGTDSITRNDLSSLCTGAYLRFLLARAERLADYFRQAATGRNMLSDIKDAQAAHEAARLLHESLARTGQVTAELTQDPAAVIQELSRTLGVSPAASIEEIVSILDERGATLERRRTTIERLLGRARDLGQYESELQQLRTLLNDSATAENALTQERERAANALEQQRGKERTALTTQGEAGQTMSTYERFQQAATLIDATTNRLQETNRSIAQVDEQLGPLTKALEAAKTDQLSKSAMEVQVERNLRETKDRLEAIVAGLAALTAVPEDAVLNAKVRLADVEKSVLYLRTELAAEARRLEVAVTAESAAQRKLTELSDSAGKFLAAATELQAAIDDDACPFCGHHHGTTQQLRAAVESVLARKVENSEERRGDLEKRAAERRERTAAHSHALEQVRIGDDAVAKARILAEQLQTQRSTVITQIENTLSKSSFQSTISIEALTSAREKVEAATTQLAIDLDLARQASANASNLRNDFEQEVAQRKALREQLQRLVSELTAQIAAARTSQPAQVSADVLRAARESLAMADRELAEARLDLGKSAAQLAEIDRALADKATQRAGANRRLEVVEGQLASLDADLNGVGATRDVASLVSLEASARQELDKVNDLKLQAQTIGRQIKELERHRAFIDAEKQFRFARDQVTKLQQRQSVLKKRANQFATVQQDLVMLQSRAAEAVLENVKRPVATMFHAMTAGCQWDIAFVPTDDGRVEARLVDALDQARPASMILNSAYLNVSAIALRIALASQQNWTTLRTVVLDDPILEMDSLTQSALIDGFEAILGSQDSPWNELQFVMTTWSEDFAVLAAHKLAHMNSGDREDFVVYRLVPELDGGVIAERHTPRWKARAHAA